MKSNLTYLKKHELFKELDNFKDSQFFAIVDYNVRNHLPQFILFSPHIFWLHHPEEEKNLDTYARATEFFLTQGITRTSTLYAIGGGATTDFAGFVAATILRGVKWIAVPTTLLAMIDGSIGGKVAINTPQGKNLLGSFYLPKDVYISGDFLSSLPKIEEMSGKGEILKYGFLSKTIHDLILNRASLETIAIECAKFKTEVVERDFYEKGERIHLNLGHTLGHAFEFMLKIPHGQGVAMGMKYLFQLLGMTDVLSKWEELATALDLPIDQLDLKHFPNFDIAEFVKFLEQDKKKQDHNLRLVLVKEVGVCYVEEVPMKEFKSKILCHESFIS